ncbi:superfamily II DNA or RNA helicase [Malaciobacter marinus]|jgi:superfamily II DNA or RNA helicase|uniref:Superfamily II DNA or RNA helicase n=1 Tax=Malaciobacter marinus TaxID=505249 RepID=A0AB36ZUI9_9BACT|nr:DEAD/DEAH box helicase family protein [Malaciobacter marinus]PPK60503.1 superfamily II DNA or RNA helicase [Malaciobacter marinus]
MIQKEKVNLSNLYKNDKFKAIIKKLTIEEELNDEEQSFILSVALVFLNHYDSDKRLSTYVEFAYFIILNYSIQYRNYKPLYDFATEFGFFPISKYIIKNNLLQNLSIKDTLIDDYMEEFSYQNTFIQTLEQYDIHNKILNDENQEISFIAPTSYGKSSIVLDLIKSFDTRHNKIGIIVPSKSLLLQTYLLIKKERLNFKLIIHDEMYNNEEKFIGILTQERALRLIDKYDVSFDVLFIDEAHNLFTKNPRSILLSRLIKKNKIKNDNSKVIYLSPLISNSNSLKIDSLQNISEQKITFNIKEPSLFEFNDNKSYIYNRFVDDFFELSSYTDYLNYIKQTSKNKNFIFLRRPLKIEEFTKKLYAFIDDEIVDDEIESLIEILGKNVHSKFYTTKFLKKGIIYIHAKIPDQIKEYLESKFKKIGSLKYIVANTVILEGINLPIDNLYILNTHSVDKNELVNLIGRVNRLNEIFLTAQSGLHKLMPNVHFLNCEFSRSNSNMRNSIKKLRSRIFDDKVSNPTLENFDIEQLDEAQKVKIERIIENEEFIFNSSNSLRDRLKKYCIENNINLFYSDEEKLYDWLRDRINLINSKLDKWNEYDVIDKVFILFVSKLDFIGDFEIERLKNKEARNFYKMHIENSHKYTLNENINKTYQYFESIKNTDDSEFYIGESYGEKRRESDRYNQNAREVYVDLSLKDEEELVNLAIVKLKIEDDFVAYKINTLVQMMYEMELLSEDEYNLHFYGTTALKNIDLIKFGLPSSLIVKLDTDNQLENISFDEFGNIFTNEQFESYKTTIDDFLLFQIEKFI